MATHIYPEEDDVIAQINVVPFVDIVLVLLIIFMLTSSAIVKAGITVDLPSAANADETVYSTLNIVLNIEGQLFLDGNEVTRRELGARIARAARKEKGLQAVISADKRIDYGRVIEVIDLIKGNGIKTFALNIQREL